MTSISQLPAEEIHRLMTTPGAMRLEDIPLVHLRAAELLKDAARYAWIRELPNADSLNVMYCGSDLDNVIDEAIGETAE